MATSAQAAASSIDPQARVPSLASSSANGLPYAVWRPQMQTYLMRQGVEARDYTRAIAEWDALVLAVQTDADDEERAAIEAVLGQGKGAPSSMSSSTTTTTTTVKNEHELAAEREAAAAKKHVAALITRARKAFGFLYAALPADLRLLVADVPQGYAYGIWSFLEKKFRNTEQDNVAALWKNFVTLSQGVDENFDEYKARVDSVRELLEHAKEQPPAGLYATLLLWNLQPRYATAVLTLKTGDRVKDPVKIDWPAIVEYMSQYERSQQSLGETDADRAMAARHGAKPPFKSYKTAASTSSTSNNQKSGGGSSAPPLNTIQCWNCKQMGHYASDCSKPKAKRHAESGSGTSQKDASSGGSSSDWQKAQDRQRNSSSRESGSEAEVDRAKAPSERAHMVRTSNRFEALSSAAAVEEAAAAEKFVARSYTAVVMSAQNVKEPKVSKLKPQVQPAVATVSVSEKKPTMSLDRALKTTSKAVDSAATVSTTCNREQLVNVRRCQPMPIRMADGTVLSAMYKGDLPLRLRVAGAADSYVRIVIPDVYFHEQFDANLLSWGNMRRDGWEMHSTKRGTHLVTPGGKRVDASTRGNLTLLDDMSAERVYAGFGQVVCMTAKELIHLHRRLGHVSWTRLEKMCKAGKTVGVGDIRNMPPDELAEAEKAIRDCAACREGKEHRAALGHRGLDKGTVAGEVLHMDTFHATMRNPTTNVKRREYCLLVVDGHTEWRWSDPRGTFAELAQAAVDIMENSRTLSGRYPRLLITDLGTEFMNKTVREFCRKHGIQVQPSPARAKELNGLAEKNVDTMKNHVRTMMLAAGVDPEFGWTYGMQHFVYVWNRTHIASRTGVTPYQAMTGREPSVINVGEFGSDVYKHEDRSERDTTFSRKAEPGIYLGHSSRQNCPIVLLVNSRKIVLSKDVHFREGSFKHLRALVQGRTEDIQASDLSDLTDDAEPRRGTAVYDEVHEWSSAAAVPRRNSTSTDKSDVEEKKYPSADEVDVVDSDADDESDESDQKYELRAVTKSRIVHGERQYRCRWAGYKSQTWEPAVTIERDAPDVVREYETSASNRTSTRASSKANVTVAVKATSPSPSAVDSVDADDAEDHESEAGLAAAYAARCL